MEEMKNEVMEQSRRSRIKAVPSTISTAGKWQSWLERNTITCGEIFASIPHI